MDGGQVALIGFLYQMIGVLAVQAWAQCPEETVENDELDALLRVVRSGEFFHEWEDIDAAAFSLAQRLGLDQSNACVLIQFKYSQYPEKYPVEPNDLEEILRNFLRGMPQWPQEERMITSYRVITNRQPSPVMKRILNKPAGQRNYKLFVEPELHALLQKTEIIPDIDFSTWKIALKKFADEYGVLPEEFTGGIHQLVGKLTERVAEGKTEPLSKEDLLTAFCGFEGAHKLTIAAIREHTVTEWNEHKENLGFDIHQMPIRRNKLFEEADNKVKEHALVIFCGPGGCGKSVMAWHFLHSKMDAPTKSSGATTVLLPALELQPRIISRVVAKWSGLSGEMRIEEMQKAIRRLQIANPGVHPVFYLGLDGVDENNVIQGYSSSIQEIIRWFWRKERELYQRAQAGVIEPPEATLIITCRDMTTVIGDILQMNFSPALRRDNAFEAILVRVMDYSSEELRTAAELLLPAHQERFNRTLLPQSMSGFTSIIDVGEAMHPAIYIEVHEALTHPAMWFALQSLTLEDQSLLFDGDLEKLDLLAEHFLFWFYEKVKRRCPDWRKNFNDVVDTLQEVAHQTANASVAEFPDTIWKDLKDSGPGLKRGDVDQLQYEAESAGLIRGDRRKRTWYWRHPFVRRYLAKDVRKGKIGS